MTHFARRATLINQSDEMRSNGMSHVNAGHVTVPVRSVQLQSEWLDGSRAEMYADQRPVVFNESDVRRLRCVVNGSYPRPQVAVYVGDHDVTRP